jgi:peptidoglycan hydrolase-like protein with peptidoglycan-binding domain
LLNQAGFNTQGVDGNFGPNTQSALMSYQYSRGLSVDGVCGPQTWSALLSNAPAVKSGPPPAPAGSSANLVAQRFLGDEQHQLEYSGQLPEDTWVPLSEDCANFVSSCLQVAGLIPASQHEDGVVNLKNNLLADGWTNTFNGSPTGVPLSAAKPGDVVCFDGPDGSFQHVEIFNGFVNGQPQYIGSNNILSDGTQEISTDTGSWAYTVHIYAPPA